MADAIEGKIEQFTSQNMSNALLAFAKLEYRSDTMLAAITVSALKKLPDFTPQVDGQVFLLYRTPIGLGTFSEAWGLFENVLGWVDSLLGF